MKTVDFHLVVDTDWGSIRLPESYSATYEALPKRKDGSPDMRYAVSNDFDAACMAFAALAYDNLVRQQPRH